MKTYTKPLAETVQVESQGIICLSLNEGGAPHDIQLAPRRESAI